MAEQDNMDTNDLMKRLSIDALGDFLKRDVSLPPFHDYISQMCLERGETREHVIKRSGINRTYGHQLFNGTRSPSRDKVIQLVLGFALDIDQTQRLLQAARECPLSPRVKRDAALIYCVMHQLDISEAQKLLEGFGLPQLGK